MKDHPHASFSAPALVPEASGGTQIDFDASGTEISTIPKGNALTSLEWDFGDGQKLVQHPADADFGIPKHLYSQPGIYKVSLTAIDDPFHPCNTDIFLGQVVINGIPTAQAGPDLSLITGEPHLFDASQSADPEGLLVGHHWSFGDGTQGAGRVIPHTFHVAGTYRVSLVVEDNNLDNPLFDTHTVNVEVKDRINIAPIASAGPDQSAFVGVPILFDASNSHDEDGNILFYRWAFSQGHTSQDPIVEHTFWAPGVYDVVLEAEDNRGEVGGVSTDTVRITVNPASNAAPTIEFPKSVDVMAFETLHLDASAAQDNDGQIVAYDWDFGDGSQGNGAVIAHQYLKAGTYNATLSLTDNATPKAAVTIHNFAVVVAYRPNVAPIADAGIDRDVLAHELIEFDATTSHDPDGAILSYNWAFGDGHSATGVTTHHIYQFPGNYTASLTIVDENPRAPITVVDSAIIRVSWPENQKPLANAGSDLSVAVGDIIPFDGSNSSDMDGNIKNYRWDFGDGGTSQQARPAHTFHDPGEYTVKLTVTDDGVVPLESNHSIVVSVVKRK
ncbi:MAG: PKD domain-containing protein [Rhizobiales bacterium]|nr:PKD domain-containing protein [Hyphomicrobiales bacterium]